METKKEQIIIQAGQTKIIVFFHAPDSKEEIKEKISDALAGVQKFFNKNEIKSKIKVNLIYSRKEFNKEIGKKTTPEWLVGIAQKNTIYIFSPEVIEKCSPSHTKDSFQKLLIHELSHIFISSYHKKLPIWLNEGLALNIARQEKSPTLKKESWEYFIKNGGVYGKITFWNFSQHDGYKIAYWLVKTLLDYSRKNKMLAFFKKSDTLNSEKRLELLLGTSADKLIQKTKKRLHLI